MPPHCCRSIPQMARLQEPDRSGHWNDQPSVTADDGKWPTADSPCCIRSRAGAWRRVAGWRSRPLIRTWIFRPEVSATVGAKAGAKHGNPRQRHETARSRSSHEITHVIRILPPPLLPRFAWRCLGMERGMEIEPMADCRQIVSLAVFGKASAIQGREFAPRGALSGEALQLTRTRHKIRNRRPIWNIHYCRRTASLILARSRSKVPTGTSSIFRATHSTRQPEEPCEGLLRKLSMAATSASESCTASCW